MQSETAERLPGPFDERTGKPEHGTEQPELLLVYLQNVACRKRLLDYIPAVEVLAQVDVEDPEARFALRHPMQEAADRISRHPAPLGQRSEAEHVRPGGQSVECRGPGDIVPGHVFPDFIGRNSRGIECDLHRSRRESDPFETMAQPHSVERPHETVSEVIGPDCADGHRSESELSGMPGEVGGSTADLRAFGEHVPQRLAHSYKQSVHTTNSIHVRFVPTISRGFRESGISRKEGPAGQIRRRFRTVLHLPAHSVSRARTAR